MRVTARSGLRQRRGSGRSIGAPIDTLDVRFVHGQIYVRLRPLIAPDRPMAKLPPVLLLKLATRLHPEMRRRNRTAGRVRGEEPWVAVIAQWHAVDKPAVVAQNLALQHVDLSGLDDDALIAHIRGCLDHCVRSWERHFWMHGYDIGPLGQYLFEAAAWGLEADELLGLLEGASASTSAPALAAERIRCFVELTGATPARSKSCAGSRRRFQSRSTSSSPIAAPSCSPATTSTASPSASDRISSSPPSCARPRETAPSRWPLGLLRLALLEVGHRLAARGGLSDAALAIEVFPDEIDHMLLHGQPGDTALRQRASLRASQKRLDAPRLLGPPEAPPPDGVLPANLAYLVGMVQTVMSHMGMDGGGQANGLRGAGIGTAAVRGRARVATSPEEALDMLEPGDVLVVAGTTPAYNLVLSLAGAVVTGEGGPMSHAAVIARELGIPAVIGARGALTDIPDGAMVEVDPVAGEVRVLSTDDAPETVGADAR